MKTQTLQERINYLKTELAAHGRHDGWLIEGFKQELQRLQEKLNGKSRSIGNNSSR